MNERYIAAIEVSSSKIVAAIGKTNGNGRLDIIAVEHEPTPEGGVRYGIIQNLEETSMIVARLFMRLEQRASIKPRKIKGVIVGLGGRSLKNITKEVSLSLPEDSEINDDILNRLHEQAIHSAIDNTLEVVDAVPRVFKVGKSETSSPKGMVGNHISAIFDLIVCRPELKKNIRRTIIDKLHLKVEGFVVTALATGHLILSPEEKRLGCMLVDMGAETTTVTIYQKGSLHYFATLPMGGRNITRDIASLGVVDSKAEEIKFTSGNAIADPNVPNLNINGLKFSEISNYVIARSEEIVANIIEQMEYAGVKDSDLQGGIICIGGGFKLKGMKDLLQIQSDLNVRKGSLPDYVKIDDPRAHGAELTEVASVLYAGATLEEVECLEMPVRSELPVNGVLPFPSDEEENKDKEEQKKSEREPSKPRNAFMENMKKWGSKLGNMFSGPEEDDSELL
ncbi:MAG: cell division protein FtsA [Muribaculaceae bacterium]|nr:cell division protein FtsA [Muribaculaceae bacterium]